MEDFSTNPKYQDILTAGKELFWKYGVKRVTTEEICSQANVSKMTFYKYFGNKIELAKKILYTISEKSMKDFLRLKNSELPFDEKLIRIFMLKMEGMKGLSKELIQDIHTNSIPELTAFLMKLSNDRQNEVINFYKEAQLNGDIRKDVNIDFVIKLSYLVAKLFEDEELMSQYSDPKDLVNEYMKTLFYGIITRK